MVKDSKEVTGRQTRKTGGGLPKRRSMDYVGSDLKKYGHKNTENKSFGQNKMVTSQQ